MSDSILILTLESTCDETAAAIIDGKLNVLGSVVASQEKLHEQFQGVVPEIAARAHVQQILPVIDATLKKSGVKLSDLDAIAVANTPGLAGSLLVGLVCAKSLCLALEIPLISINHLHAHIYACRMAAKKNVFPCIGLVISGGHSHLYECKSPFEFRYLGGTIDDAAGEAFDKVASMLSLPYPGGPAISKIAVNGNPKAFQFPRTFIKDDRLDFSFSGLKTAVRYTIGGKGKLDFSKIELSESMKADIAASFQAAVVDVLVSKAIQACERTSMQTLCIGGGVAANREFRDRMKSEADDRSIELHIAPLELCTDNAVMGAIAIEKFQAGQIENLELDIIPGLIRS